MRAILLPLLFIGSTVACYGSTQVRTANGNIGYSIHCRSWAFGGIDDCQKEAGEMCPHGYSILERGGIDTAYAFATGYSLHAGVRHSDNFLIECKLPPIVSTTPINFYGNIDDAEFLKSRR